MANKSTTFLYLVLLSFFPAIALSSSAYKYQYGPKCESLTVYEQEIFNKTSFRVVEGVAGSESNPFGSIDVLADKLTRTANPSSEVIGDNQAIFVVTSFNGESGIAKDNYSPIKNDKKSRISTQGIFNNVKPSNVSITGGTGYFTGAKGYYTSIPVFFNKKRATFQITFYYCLPSYAKGYKDGHA